MVFSSSATQTSQIPVDSITHVLALPVQPPTTCCQPSLSPSVLDFQPPLKISRLKTTSFLLLKFNPLLNLMVFPATSHIYQSPDLLTLPPSTLVQDSKNVASPSLKPLTDDLAVSNPIFSPTHIISHPQSHLSKSLFENQLSILNPPPVFLNETTLPMGFSLPSGET